MSFKTTDTVEVSNVVRERGLQQPYAVWCALRELDGGQGWLTLQVAIDGLQQDFGVDESTVHHWLTDDDAQIFWSHARRRRDGISVVFLHGVAKVHASLGCATKRRSVPPHT